MLGVTVAVSVSTGAGATVGAVGIVGVTTGVVGTVGTTGVTGIVGATGVTTGSAFTSSLTWGIGPTPGSFMLGYIIGAPA